MRFIQDGPAIMAEPKKTGKPVRFDGQTYESLRLVARATGKDIAVVARELLRAPLSLQLSKLAPEIAEMKRMEAQEAKIAEKGLKKFGDAE